MICAMVHQLLKGATIKEIEEVGINYADHNVAIYPTDASGNPFSATYFQSKGDPLADLTEDMAAEQKARATYENLMQLTNDEDVIGPLLFLRQREVVHYNRFKKLFEYYESMGH